MDRVAAVNLSAVLRVQGVQHYCIVTCLFLLIHRGEG